MDFDFFHNFLSWYDGLNLKLMLQQFDSVDQHATSVQPAHSTDLLVRCRKQVHYSGGGLLSRLRTRSNTVQPRQVKPPRSHHLLLACTLAHKHTSTYTDETPKQDMAATRQSGTTTRRNDDKTTRRQGGKTTRRHDDTTTRRQGACLLVLLIFSVV